MEELLNSGGKIFKFSFFSHTISSRCEAKTDSELLATLTIRWKNNGNLVKSEGTKVQILGCKTVSIFTLKHTI